MNKMEDKLRQEIARQEFMDSIERDWTRDPVTNRSSEEYLHVVRLVTETILESAHSLIHGHAENVARVIVSTLAHHWKFSPERWTAQLEKKVPCARPDENGSACPCCQSRFARMDKMENSVGEV